ncbi:uncharacterized protein J4E78_007289 [Alternaria triticimaculans]|uniref:uncharacterized protein n=1 Tax=Alternaria triticimaculans TaxID=297637 RepID=UPI0020C4A4BA|nr:uncharacterized protein J4E78_007289 [Alternaria triticimaculans]KAI4654244.1 hypothetical protein J4E78_007289 [Alternaria triticimaculans]
MESDRGKRADATHPASGDSTNKTSDSYTPLAPVTAEAHRNSDRTTTRDTAPDCSNEDEMAPLPTSPILPLGPEKLHVLLTYSALLALTRHSSQPVVDLDMQAQVRQLDAFLAGDITDEGVATHWSAESQRSERLQRYQHLCDELVPNLTAAVKKQSRENLNAEPKNRVHGDRNPEHRPLSQLFLAKNLVTMYGAWVEKARKKGIDPDVDPWTNPTKFSKVIPVFESIFTLQYNFDDWQHTSPKPVFNQTARLDAEEFMRVMDNHDQIRVYHRINTPLGNVFAQMDVIPEIATKYSKDELTSMWRDKTRPKYLIPDPTTVTIPNKQKNTYWQRSDDGKTWTRGETSWAPTFKFMVFDTATHAYIHEHLVDLDHLDQIDLNDDTSVLKYRKKLSQWRNRDTGETTKMRDPWTDDERAIVYEWVNTWVKKNGVDKLLPRVMESGREDLQATLVAKTGFLRSVDSVSGWARQQITNKPKEPLGMLYIEGQKVAARIEAGESIPDDERYPDEAIDIADFLAKATLQISSKHDRSAKKRKHDSDDESSIDVSFDEQDDDNDLPPSPPRKSDKRPRLSTKGRIQPGRDAPLTKAEMDARNEAYAAKEVNETVEEDEDINHDDEDITREVDMIYEFGDDKEE